MRFQALIVAAVSAAQLVLSSPVPEPTACADIYQSWYDKKPFATPDASWYHKRATPDASWYHKREAEATATADAGDNLEHAPCRATVAAEA
ncbi:hypothetical protein ISF_05845 [Cordyceps fumosorosea ARSEF 2679]|uniref:Uncharacterized protein n=1 Tax=Cordyceps fumosorosea (strain ARSEF 2679) TaxID=1081104 RepID=A0A167TPA4_CORFA|nr:hypothetical protein ISF_05845 [Cordyceps fumosorosea ARSEF 2679]OAA60806.1 hypothetical protein ISF_05845 [Cordyceps fumosorosea ARSEF 2679]